MTARHADHFRLRRRVNLTHLLDTARWKTVVAFASAIALVDPGTRVAKQIQRTVEVYDFLLVLSDSC